MPPHNFLPRQHFNSVRELYMMRVSGRIAKSRRKADEAASSKDKGWTDKT